MNNPNPFVPKGSLLEQQSQRRSRVYIAVSCVLAVSVLGLVGMLIQGCKRENPETQINQFVMDTNPPALDMTSMPVVDTNPPVPVSPVQNNTVVIPPPVPPTPVEAAGSEYAVVQGDTLGKIAKAHGVSLKALEAANPGVDSKKLQIKQKLVIPAPTKSAEVAPVTAMGAVDMGGESYTVKSGDTLDKIARAHHTTAKAIQAANNLSTTKILVGHKLKLPAKAEAAAPSPALDTTTAPALPPISAPVTPAPAPAR